MRLAQKLILFALAVALIPLAATGFSAIRIGEDALRSRITDHQRAAAVAVASKVSQAVEELAKRLATVMELVDAQGLSSEERLGLARMLYRQSDDISLAVLLDGEGALLAPAVFVESPETQPELSAHPGAVAAEAERLISALPRPTGSARAGTLFLSSVYFPEGRGARLAVAIPGGVVLGRPTVLAGVEVALRRDVLRVAGIDTGPESSVFVVDPGGRVIAHPRLEVGSDLTSQGAVQAFVRDPRGAAGLYDTPEGRQVAAFAPVGRLGWGVVVEQPEEVAFAAAASMRRQVLLWIVATAVIVLVGGLAFAGRLTRTLNQMMEGARAFGEGRLKRRIDVHSKDEIGELAETMNAMAARLEKSLREIEEWSATLEAKVAQRTRELEATQAQLLVQSKLAAIGQLGAGVAHEINNPLAGVLGLAQLMMRDQTPADKGFSKLQEIEAAAKRCKDIIQRLLRFSERRLVGRVVVSLNDIVDEVAEMLLPGLRAAKIELKRELAVDLPKVTADPGQLAQVFINLINNSKTALPTGGVITVRTTPNGDGVRVEVTDTGVGIKKEHLPRVFDPFFTTKRVWSDVGLGLSVSYRIVTDHGGRIEAASEEGQGSSFTVTLPKTPPVPDASATTPDVLRKSILLE
jgi:two-component system, NtrC family, sensor kinase